MSRDMYRKLNWQGGTPREVSEVVNNLVEGKSNNTGEFTLATGGATSTTLYDERIGYNSVILFMPTTSSSAYFALPYGSFQDSTDQSVSTTTASATISLNITDFALGTSLVSGSRIKVDYAGLYNVQFSLQFVNPDNQQHDVDVWFRKNGVDIDNSNSQFTVPVRKNASIYGHLIAALNFFVELDKDDYIELAWASSSTLVTIETIGAQTSPTRPATPSAILTIQYVSSNAFTANIFSEPYVSSTSKGSAIISHPANSTANVTYRYIVVA